MKNVSDGRVSVDPAVKADLTPAEASAYLLKDGDILLNRTNSPDLVGKTGIFRGTASAVFASYLVRLQLDEEAVDPDFVIQVLASEEGQREIRRLATRAVGQANLNPTTFKRHFSMPLPPLTEQARISKLLGTWDHAIEKLRQLIEAKDRLLSGFREALLKPASDRIRVPLREITKETAHRNRKRLGRAVVMAVMKDVGMRPMRERTIASDTSRYKVVRPKGFAYNPMRLNIGSIAMSPFADDVLVSPDYVVFECDEARLLPGYLNHSRYSRRWAAYFGAAGNGSVRVRIYYDDLAAFTLALPPVEAQRSVVGFLDSLTMELAALRAYCRALRNQKRGLMQQLLAGKRRLSAAEAEAV